MLKNEYHVVGLMSGTSLDGLDVVACRFNREGVDWKFDIAEAKTLEYSAHWKQRLSNAHHSSALELAQLNADLGLLHASWINELISDRSNAFDFIASHGHTIFHQPSKGFTTQIGSASHIAVHTGLPVIADFRLNDVALGGQGAPLVPVGDWHLFSAYDSCLNLGGVANISIKTNNSIKAFDICICNLAMNELANQRSLDFDEDGAIAAQGTVVEELLQQLNNSPFYTQAHPKSLGREFYESEIKPLIQNSKHPLENVMCTVVEHIAMQIAECAVESKKVLVTGGGAFNTFLMDRLKHLSAAEIVLPEKQIIQFKEALIFAFLGVLRMRGENNCLASVTGASRDNIGGAVYLP